MGTPKNHQFSVDILIPQEVMAKITEISWQHILVRKKILAYF